MTADRAFPPTVYQSFESKSDPAEVGPRIRALRKELDRAGLDAFLVPRADAHRGEAVPASEARLMYVTGFSGSAGIAIVGRKKAGLFIDSRYTLQAPMETDTSLVTVIQTLQGQATAQLAEFAPKGRIGYDPWLHTPGEIKELSEKLAGKATLVATENLVDRMWTDRPAPPVTPIEFLGHNRAGKLSKDKIAELKDVLKAEDADAVVITLPESICWLFNIRGRDVPNTPSVLGFAIVPRTGKPTT
jgi:Xaa-Pro aminopeptidase